MATRKQARDGLRGLFIRDVNAADRTDFARHCVLHTTLMKPVARNAPAGRTPVGEAAPALTATTGIFSPEPISRPANAAARTAGIRNGTREPNNPLILPHQDKWPIDDDHPARESFTCCPVSATILRSRSPPISAAPLTLGGCQSFT